MNAFDFYRDTEMDVSVVLNYPRGMTGVLSAMQEILKQRGRLIVEEGELTLNRAKEIVASASGDTRVYYLIQTTDPKVWSVLKEPVNRDDIRILAVFHGQIPSEVPENLVVIDLGRSLHRKVSKAVVATLTEALTSKGKFPTGSSEELYYGLQALCYEALYTPEGRMFPKVAAEQIPRSHAFQFMYNPPQLLTEASMTSAVHRFVEDVHGWMG